MIISKVEASQLRKPKKAAGGVDRTVQTTAIEIKRRHITSVLIAFNAIPRATISTVAV